jgi:beta-xylosidase
MRATRRAVWLAAGSCAAGLGLLLVAGPSVLVGDVACGAEPGTVKEPTGAPGQPSSVPVGLRKLMDVPLRDPSICVGPDGTYYLTGTSEPFWGFNNDNGIRVWKSGDMVSWQPLGTVWRYGESPWHKKYLEARKPLWAPEIHYLKNTFWLTYSMPGWDGTAKTSGSGLLKSTSGRPEGPYVDMQPAERMGDEIDATLFQDEDGQVYFAWHSGKVARLKDNMSGLAEPYHWLKSAVADPDPKHHSGLCAGIFGKDSFDHVGYEGMFLFKRQGRYYLCCSEQIDGRYSCMVATSTSLLGPYSARYEAIRHGGHNAFFVDASGQWWSTFFGPPYSERAAVLPVHFDAEGRLACGKLSP